MMVELVKCQVDHMSLGELLRRQDDVAFIVDLSHIANMNPSCDCR